MSSALKEIGKSFREACRACGLVRCTISARGPVGRPGITWSRGTAVAPKPYPVLPVVGVQLYRQDAVVVRRGVSREGVFPIRGDVSVFSWRSRKRLAFVASNTDIMFTSMVTLTYPRQFPNDGDDVKRNLKAFREALRRKVPGVSMLWFLEFQRRGAPHVHIMLRGVRVYKAMQHWVSETWYRICGTGDLRHLAAGTRLERVRNPNGARNYCVKYCSKMRQKVVPPNYRNVGRFWGHSRDVRPIMRCETTCTNDDLVGALESTGWEYLKGETIRYHTLYGAASKLTNWLNRDTLVLSTSSQSQQGDGLAKERMHDGYETFRNDGRRIRAHHNARIRYGG